jgi:hypothetical protein
MKAKLVAAILMIAVASTAFARGFHTGAELKTLCDAEIRVSMGTATAEDLRDDTLCLGYIQGVVDALDGHAFCSTDRLVGAQVIAAIVRNFINRNPQYLNQTASQGVVGAFQHEFPCPKK